MYRKKCVVMVLSLLWFSCLGAAEEGLVGYWNFDADVAPTVTDLSGNGNNGTLMGNAGLLEGADLAWGGTGQSLDLNFGNSDSDWVEIPHSESLNITEELTILAWIRPDMIDNWDGLVTKGSSRSPWSLRFNNANGLRLSVNAGNMDDPNDPNYAPGAVGGGSRQSTMVVPDVNEAAGIDWTFVGVISDGTHLKFMVNLEEQVFPVRFVFGKLDQPLYLGRDFQVSEDPINYHYFNGLMDEVRIYNRAISRREVIAISGLAEKPFEPEPADGASGVVNGVLTWGQIDGTEKVYAGASPDTLELVAEGTEGTHTLADLAAGQMVYWRVDAGDVTGDVWSFTTAEEAASGPRPSDQTDFVAVDGLNLQWLPAFGAVTAYEVFLGDSPENLVSLGQVTEAAYKDAAKTLVSETVHYWRVDALKEGDVVVTGSVWSFKTVPIFPVEEAHVAWYKFELGEGGSAVDWTRNGNSGALAGDTVWVTDGYAGGAVAFDGDSDYVEIPQSVTDDWTIMLWLKTSNLEQSWPGRLGGTTRVRNGAGIVDGDAGGGDENMAMSLNGGNIMVNCMGNGAGGDGGPLVSDAQITADEWHSVAWTRDAETGEMALFMNGVPDATGQAEKWIGTKDTQGFLWLGGLEFANKSVYYEGMIDEVKLFSRILDVVEIQDELRPDKRVPYAPQPPMGTETGLGVAVELSWRAGDGATAHNVYFGTETEPPLISGAQAEITKSVGQLTPGTYYWQIGEIMADGAEIKGPVWMFTVADLFIVDNFETYTNQSPFMVFQQWIDGLGYLADDFLPEQPGNGTGAIVGHNPEEGDVMETLIVNPLNGGTQAMPMIYGDSAKNVSETTRQMVITDWTQAGITSLVLYFHGDLGNSASDKLYVKINDTRVDYSGAATDITQPVWTQWTIDLAQVVADLKNVQSLTIGVEGTGAIGIGGLLIIDDIGLYPTPPTPSSDVLLIEAEAADELTSPLEVISDFGGATLGGQYIGTLEGSGNSPATPPDPNGTATYSVTVVGGTYRLSCRVSIPTAQDNSFWVRIPTATVDRVVHESGWIQWQDAAVGEPWHWDDVSTFNDNNQTVLFTLTPGTHTLQIGYREDGGLLDAIMLTRQD